MPRTRTLAWSELKIGLLALVAIALMVVLIFLVGGAQGGFFWQRYELRTRFDNVQGLKPGAVVRVAGMEMGSVTGVRFVDAEVEVVLQLHRAARERVTTRSIASLGAVSLLGEGAVDITASVEGEPLAAGTLIPSRPAPTQLADVTEQAASGLAEITELLRGVRAGEGTLGRLVTDDVLYQEITRLVDAAEDVTRAIGEGEGTLGRLARDPGAYQSLDRALGNLRDITARLNAGEGGLGRLLHDEAFGRSLTATSQNLDELTARLARGEGTAGKLVTDERLYTQLASVTERLDGLLARLDAGEGTAGRLLQDRHLYENMNTAVQELHALIADIRADPQRFLRVRVSIF